MAMMMTGRVLLVCALCVLWCGAGWVYAGDVENNAGEGFMASGVLGVNRLRVPSVCGKVAITLPSRMVSFITAAEASTNDDASGIIGGNPDSPSGAAAAGSVSGGAGGAGGSGGGGGTSGGSGNSAGGSDGNRDTTEDPKGVGGGSLQSPPSVDPNSSRIPNEVGESQNTEASLSPEETISPEAAAESGPTASPGNTPPKVETADKSKPKEEEKELSVTQAAAPISVNGNASTGEQNPHNDVGKVDHSSNQTPPPVLPSAVTSPAPSKEPALPATEPSPSDGSIPAPNVPQNAKDQEQKTSVLTIKMESNAPEIPSEDNVVQQQGQNTTTEELMETSSRVSQAETTTTSIYTSGTGEAQSTADADDAQRPNPSESQNDLEGTDIINYPTASEAAPQTAETATTAHKNDTAAPGDSDGSTAVSHTTFPLLLLLLVACAAAAAVVAA
ncbi:Mucin-associated surface protein (MASP) [Trypanosoma cruzi]|uniref:Mucin-associated surface protein (MASP), putative n=2 Tax=Trypanosoma cruzi TaxID=5693 RepID=Q4CUF7_TRYCC|nr:mucin-associated surface protein (MASP), putative [Trypanosoma cruzi]EAN83907.1 mucin-associated surface protein (MASP), putative [Trypanosoma cruzi]PWV19871.1 Mucin-associated surface protein (MASP) [Trypanosoma cruzi]|eukprot:XP_805758.1 mucin-associated surface protein (MASP) [Trypanosoma cruzi strain CL Brener]